MAPADLEANDIPENAKEFQESNPEPRTMMLSQALLSQRRQALSDRDGLLRSLRKALKASQDLCAHESVERLALQNRLAIIATELSEARERTRSLQIESEDQISRLQVESENQISRLQVESENQIRTLQLQSEERIRTIQAETVEQIRTLKAEAAEQIGTLQADLFEKSALLQASLQGRAQLEADSLAAQDEMALSRIRLRHFHSAFSTLAQMLERLINELRVRTGQTEALQAELEKVRSRNAD